MVIHGGINEDGKPMDCLWVCDLKTFKWKQGKTLDKIDPHSVKRAFKHTQMFKINDDGTQGDPLDSSNI
jgi:hypothetical protein